MLFLNLEINVTLSNFCENALGIVRNFSWGRISSIFRQENQELCQKNQVGRGVTLKIQFKVEYFWFQSPLTCLLMISTAVHPYHHWKNALKNGNIVRWDSSSCIMKSIFVNKKRIFFSSDYVISNNDAMKDDEIKKSRWRHDEKIRIELKFPHDIPLVLILIIQSLAMWFHHDQIVHFFTIHAHFILIAILTSW